MEVYALIIMGTGAIYLWLRAYAPKKFFSKFQNWTSSSKLMLDLRYFHIVILAWVLSKNWSIRFCIFEFYWYFIDILLSFLEILPFLGESFFKKNGHNVAKNNKIKIWRNNLLKFTITLILICESLVTFWSKLREEFKKSDFLRFNILWCLSKTLHWNNKKLDASLAHNSKTQPYRFRGVT